MSQGSSDLVQHYSRGWIAVEIDYLANGAIFVKTKVTEVDDFEDTAVVDGWWFWAGWCVLSFLLLFFKRYLKQYW